MSYTLVTTFSNKGYEVYGQAFLDSFVEHGDGLQCLVYHESQGNVDVHPRLEWRNLDWDRDREKFIQDWGKDPDKVGTPQKPNGQAIRFCHKVFALTDAVKHCKTDWLIWVDADVTFHAPIKPELEHICLDGTLLAFLGRVSAPYTECGFVAYKVSANPVKQLLNDMRHYYTSGDMFLRPKTDWHDSKCFDVCRAASGIPEHKQHNLSEGLHGWHVWPRTLLERFSRHQKGPTRKRETYGNIAP